MPDYFNLLIVYTDTIPLFAVGKKKKALHRPLFVSISTHPLDQKKDLSSGYPTVPTSPRSVNISSRSQDISDISTLLSSRSPISPSLDKNFSEQSETLSEPASTPSTSAEFFSKEDFRETFSCSPCYGHYKNRSRFRSGRSPTATAYADRRQLEDFMSTVNQHLDKLETAFADVARLEAALAESERARKELESRLAAVSSSSSSPGPAPCFKW
ncbi:MAG: hypothetical protein EXX96DRAFT_616692 [Benjaminiella poitrasii]|nr:MAG: hypothetical protein EXX96DRAFT_616692 [Benjaminiella poitrasii]